MELLCGNLQIVEMGKNREGMEDGSRLTLKISQCLIILYNNLLFYRRFQKHIPLYLVIGRSSTINCENNYDNIAIQ